jgi:tRNA(fMet)-specific endonuclease VapC
VKFLLDANAVIAFSVPGSALASRLLKSDPQDFGISAIVFHALYFGAFKSARQARNLRNLEAIGFDIVDFDRRDARHAGEIRAALVAAGTPIGPYDVLIAGQARARDLTLITNNTREFRRVPGLRIEDWQS